jgi:hypothetical protein
MSQFVEVNLLVRHRNSQNNREFYRKGGAMFLNRDHIISALPIEGESAYFVCMAGVAEDRSDTVIIDRESMFNVIDGASNERAYIKRHSQHEAEARRASHR